MKKVAVLRERESKARHDHDTCQARTANETESPSAALPGTFGSHMKSYRTAVTLLSQLQYNYRVSIMIFKVKPQVSDTLSHAFHNVLEDNQTDETGTKRATLAIIIIIVGSGPVQTRVSAIRGGSGRRMEERI
jgi:hypothetical protein